MYYFPAGSLLPSYLDEKTNYIKYVKKIDAIFCETNGLINELRERGINNLYLSHTFDLRGSYPFIPKQVSFANEFYFCSFCRITKSKGIALACEAINRINKDSALNLTIHYDIYGKLDPLFELELNSLIKESDGMIKYCGLIKDGFVIDTLSKYDANIFASYFEGECLPATVIESLKASTPLIISDWKYNKEIITDGVEGFVFGRTADDLINTIINKCGGNNPFPPLRINCYKKSKLFLPELCLSELFLMLDE